jgi:hypothetical protein
MRGFVTGGRGGHARAGFSFGFVGTSIMIVAALVVIGLAFWSILALAALVVIVFIVGLVAKAVRWIHRKAVS